MCIETTSICIETTGIETTVNLKDGFKDTTVLNWGAGTAVTKGRIERTAVVCPET